MQGSDNPKVYLIVGEIVSLAAAAFMIWNGNIPGCLEREPPAVHQGKFDPRAQYKAFMALHDIRS